MVTNPPDVADKEAYAKLDNGIEIYFEKYNLNVSYIRKDNGHGINLITGFLRFGRHECKELLKYAEGVVFCEHCGEVVNFD